MAETTPLTVVTGVRVCRSAYDPQSVVIECGPVVTSDGTVVDIFRFGLPVRQVPELLEGLHRFLMGQAQQE